MKNYIVLFVLCLSLFTGCKEKKLPAYELSAAPNLLAENHGLIKLKTTSDQTICSGFVISKHYALTAAHCTESYNVFKVYNTENKYTNVNARVVKQNERLDIALLYGDFSNFLFVKVYQDSEEFLNFTMRGLSIGATPYQACGYPNASLKPWCSLFYSSGMSLFQIRGIGVGFPGMSGGPVFHPINGEIIGVIAAVSEHENTMYVAPLFKVFDRFEIEVKE